MYLKYVGNKFDTPSSCNYRYTDHRTSRMLTQLFIPPGDAMESRLAEIEIKLSYSEDMLEELNRTVFRQQQQIEHLQKELRVLSQQLQTDETQAEPRNLRDEIPPHY